MRKLYSTTLRLSLLLFAASANSIASDMTYIAAGPFVFGSDKTDTEDLTKQYGNKSPLFLNEHPIQKPVLAPYYIDTFEVTLAQYRKYISQTGKPAPRYWLLNGYALSLKKAALQTLPQERLQQLVAGVMKVENNLSKASLLKKLEQHWAMLDKLPVEFISWHQADDYCQHQGKRLPTEQEWEKAARGVEGNEYTWGPTWHKGWSNTGDEQWPLNVAPVGSYQKDQSAFHVYDLAGNVSEWVANWYQPYAGNHTPDADYGQKHKVIRGGAYGSTGHYALSFFSRNAFRHHLPADDQKAGLGFRCAM